MPAINKLEKAHEERLVACPDFDVFPDKFRYHDDILNQLIEAELINEYTTNPHPDGNTYRLSRSGGLLKSC